jgi:hypothetical protein
VDVKKITAIAIGHNSKQFDGSTASRAIPCASYDEERYRFLRDQNIDPHATNTAEKYCSIIQRYLDGGYPGSFGYHRYQQDLANVGKIRPVA